MPRFLPCLLAALLPGAPGIRAEPPPGDLHPGETLIVLAAPPAGDPYYRPMRQAILEFQTTYARQIKGRDHVVILADKATCRELAPSLPPGLLLEAPMRDIWTRDFFPVLPENPVLFRYAPAAQSGHPREADRVQAAFLRFARRQGLAFRRAPWILDGGNLVDNGADKAIVSDRFLTDNALSKPRAVALLRDLLDVRQVAVLPADPDDPLGHADGMVSFIDTNTVAVTSGDGLDRDAILLELRTAFPGIQIIEIHAVFDDNSFDPAFPSAMGLYVNATVTDRFIYLPVFGLETDAAAITAFRTATPRQIVPVDAAAVSRLGGSVRCLGAQLKGENARRLLQAARNTPAP